LVRAFVFGVSVADPIILGVLAAGMALPSAAAIWAPARRATVVSPVVAIRVE